MEDRRPEVLVVSIVFFLIATVFVALRFVSRIFIVRRLSLHDYVMLVAWVSRPSYRATVREAHWIQVIDFGFSFSLFYATSKGLGLHDPAIDIQARSSLNRANYVFTVLYVSALDPVCPYTP